MNTLLPWIDHIKNIGCNAIYIGPVPVLVLGTFALFPDVLKRKEVASSVVEHAVKDHPDFFFVRL